jgi:hypothetical protein
MAADPLAPLPSEIAALAADPTTTLAAPRDFYRANQAAQRSAVARVPDAANYFSELPHHPRATYRVENANRFQPRNMPLEPAAHAQLQATAPARRASQGGGVGAGADTTLVAGTHRFKYFRRPNAAYVEVAPATM